MRFLLDTNILIGREDYKITPPDVQDMFRYGILAKIQFLVHSVSVQDIERDKNEQRREILLAKIKAYPLLESPCLPDFNADPEFFQKIGYPQKPQDYVDSTLLYSVYKNAVDFLISEDQRLHRKAKKLSIARRVLHIDDAVSYFRNLLPKNKVSAPPAVKNTYVHNLNIADRFFDSLKRQYPEFEEWFENISRQGRKCFVFWRLDGTIGGLLIYKIEEEPVEATPRFLPKKRRLKLCTFKVEHTGYKLGELFIKLAIEYSVVNRIDEMYLTCFEKGNDRLIDLITEYGFIKWGTNSRGESVFLKKLVPAIEDIHNLSPFEIDTRFYPTFYDGEKVNKYIIPIRPEYHERLFIEYPRTPTLWESVGEFIIEGNAIKKAYLCHSRIRAIKQADIIFFYRSHDMQKLTCMGIVHEVYPGLTEKHEIMKLVAKRTVYSEQEIAKIAKKPTLVILFTLNFYLPESLELKNLIEMGIIRSAPRSILQISHDKYLKIKKESGIDVRFTIN